MVEDTPARRLLGGAIGFAAAAKLLFDASPSRPVWTTCFVNLGFAFELGLKAFLMAKGLKTSDLKALGHDLDALMARAVELGLKVDPEIPAYAKTLSDGHKDMSIRYLEGGPKELPAIPDTCTAVTQLILDVAEQGNLGPTTEEESSLSKEELVLVGGLWI